MRLMLLYGRHGGHWSGSPLPYHPSCSNPEQSIEGDIHWWQVRIEFNFYLCVDLIQTSIHLAPSNLPNYFFLTQLHTD